MIVGSIGQFSMFGAIAEQMRTLDALTLRAGEGVVDTASALAAEMVLETQRIAEAIAAAATDADRVVSASCRDARTTPAPGKTATTTSVKPRLRRLEDHATSAMVAAISAPIAARL